LVTTQVHFDKILKKAIYLWTRRVNASIVLSMKVITREEALAIYDAGPEAVVKAICGLSAQVVALEKQVVLLEQRITVLEEHLAVNSRNSSKPPSSDGLKKQTRSQRPIGERKPGGQNGHQGHTLKMVKNPDHIKIHPVDECKNCQCSLTGQKADAIERRQVLDIPPNKLQATEHRVETKKCPECEYVNKAEFPEDVNAPVQYGPRIKAMAVYLKGYQLLPLERTAELFEDLFGCPLSEGTIDNIINITSQHLEVPVEQIKEQVKAADVGHFDETGMSVMGKRHWLHTASTSEFTYYEIHGKRGSEAMDDIGILPEFQGRAIHDFWKPYWTYEDCAHGLCNAHHLRELTFLHEEQQQAWAKNMIDCLLKIKETVDEARHIQGYLEKEQIKTFEAIYESILAEGYAENPVKDKPPGLKKRGRIKKSKARNLLERLDEYQSETLAFVHDFNVPFDNNLAERDVRMAKVQQKISGTFRSENGAKAFCRIRSYISTVKKNSLNVLEAIEDIFKGSPFVPQMNIA